MLLIMFFGFNVICLMASSVLAGIHEPFFRDDYTYEKTTNAFYKLNTPVISWEDAVKWCQEEGANLAYPQTETEAKILLSYIEPFNFLIWLGLSDIYAEGVFMSIDGQPISKMYHNWGLAEPNDIANEDCVTLNKNGFYSDTQCHEKNKFICKKENKDIVLNHKCLTHDQNYKFNHITNSCYKVHPEPSTWHQAFRICRNEMGKLVSINSEAEAAYLVEEFRKFPPSSLKGKYTYKEYMLIDANALYSKPQDIYVTSEGKTLEQNGYSKWVPGEPNNMNNKEHCGSMDRKGLLNDVGCDDLCLFACEKAGCNK